MDAAHNLLKKTALFLATALLLAVPGRAQTLVPSSTTVGLSGNQGQSITLTSSGATISYTVPDKPFWVSVVSSNNFTTPDTLGFQIANSNCGTLPCTGTVTLRPSSGAADVPITVTYNNTGGGGTGTITASPPSVTLNAAAGQNASQNVSLSSAGTTSILTITPNQPWLSASANPLTVNGVNSSILTIFANSSGLGTGTFNGQIVLTPSTGTQTTIPVTFVVGGSGGGTGNLQVSQSSFQFAYPSGTQQAFVNVSSATLSNFSFQVASNGGNWLLFDGTTGGSAFVGSGHSISINTAVAGSLPTNTYQGTITLTNPANSNDFTTISVSLSVNGSSGGGGGTFSVTPASALNFTATAGGNSQSQNLVITAPSNATVQVTGSSFNGNFFSVSSPSCSGSGSFTCTFVGSQTLVFTVAPQSLVQSPYNASVLVQSGSSSAQLSLHLEVVNSTTALTVSPGAATFTAVAGGAPQTQTLQVNVPNADLVQATISQSNLGSFFTVSPFCSGLSTCSFNGSQTLTVTVNPANLTSAGTYTGSILFQSGGTSTTIPVNLILTSTGGGGGGGGGSNGGIAAPTSLAFAYQTGSSANLPPQVITVAPAGSFSVNTTVSTSQQWLSAAAQGTTAPNRVTVTVNPLGLPNGTYQGTVAINSTAGTQSVTVTLLVTASMVIEVNPGSYSNFYQASSGVILQPTFGVAASDNSATNVTVASNTSWITVPIQGAGTTPAFFSVTLNPSGLCNGLNSGSFTVTAPGALNSPATVPVVLFVSGSTVTSGCNTGGGTGPLTFTSSSLTFNAQVNGVNPTAQPLGVTVPSSAPFFSVSASVQTGGTNWLLVTPTGNLSGSQNLNVSVSQSNLPVGTYNGTITFNTGGTIQTVPVTLVVSTTGTGALNVSATTLNFTFTPGGSTPASQPLNVTSASGTNTTFTYSATSPGNFLSATANSITLTNGQVLSTPANLTISANPAGLQPGQTYTGTITLTPSGSSPVTITVNLTISNASVLTVSTTNLTFTYNAGDSAPSPQTVTVSGAQGLTFTAAASSSGNWLSVSPTSGTIGSSPSTLTVSVNPTGLNAGPYTGTITVAGTGTATGSTPISVTLTVNAPRPTITSVASAASYVGGSISPGEVITIFGTSIGPTPGVSLALDSTGKVATTLGGVQVLINGFLAPMVYASNTQVSAVVPYEVAGGPGTIGQVVVKFLGQSSNGIGTPVASSVPGLFTANASGSGPGAILNANNSANSPANPANRGDTIAIYLTGEGQTSPSGITGKVTTVSGVGPLTPVPLLPVGALIDGSPAAISFAGEAPGLVSGVMQLNVTIPPGTKSGPLSLVVSIGGVSSQAGVTVSVR